MFQQNKFTDNSFLILFVSKNHFGKCSYWVIDGRIWHNAATFAIESYRNSKRYTKGVFCFGCESDATDKVNQLLTPQKQTA